MKLTLVLGAAALAALTFYFFVPSPRHAEAATAGTITYTYDSLGRIIGEVNSAGNSGTFAYDAAGNRTSSSLN